MRYFTFALWQRLQQSDSEKAERRWINNIRLYQSQLSNLKAQLGRRVYQFFTTEGLHDGLITKIEIGKKRSILILVQKLGISYELSFSGVSHWSIRYDQETNSLSFNEIFEWSYEEFSRDAEGELKLEILFSSGAICTVNFNKLKIKAR